SHIEAKLAVAESDLARYAGVLKNHPAEMVYQAENVFYAVNAQRVATECLSILSSLLDNYGPSAAVDSLKETLKNQIVAAAKNSIPQGDVSYMHMELIYRQERALLLDEIEWM